ncbi:MAG: helix-turn-helix domain-containing protein [Chloroflexi bacterium]|nr:helix-turn-helix domain-containing protein [Chloroflexota bacterium]
MYNGIKAWRAAHVYSGRPGIPIEGHSANDLLSLREAADRTGVSASHLRLLARTGRIQASKLGRDWFTTETAVLAYLADTALRKKDPYKRQRGG